MVVPRREAPNTGTDICNPRLANRVRAAHGSALWFFQFGASRLSVGATAGPTTRRRRSTNRCCQPING